MTGPVGSRPGIILVALMLSGVGVTPAMAQDDVALARSLKGQAGVKVEASMATMRNFLPAYNSGDIAGACRTARSAHSDTQQAYDLSMRMSRLRLEAHNAEIARGMISRASKLLDNTTGLIRDYCSGTAANTGPAPAANNRPAYNYEDEKDFGGLNAGTQAGNGQYARGETAAAAGDWAGACGAYAAAEQAFRFNSGFATKIAKNFAAHGNPKPELAPLSVSLLQAADNAKGKLDAACNMDRLGLPAGAGLSASNEADLKSLDDAIKKRDAMANGASGHSATKVSPAACKAFAPVVAQDRLVVAQITGLLKRYDSIKLRAEKLEWEKIVAKDSGMTRTVCG